MTTRNEDTGRPAAAAAPSEGNTERPSSINILDDFDAAKEWMLRGRVDTKGFAKYLPHTAKDLKDKRVTPEQVVDDLKYLYKPTIMFAGDVTTAAEALAQLAAMAALPDSMFLFIRSETKQFQMIYSFQKEMQSRLEESENNGRDLLLDDPTEILKQYVDEVCEKLAGGFDRELFIENSGHFLRKCPLYKAPAAFYKEDSMPIDRFVDYLDLEWSDKNLSMLATRRSYLSAATHNVANGMHDVHDLCWECQDCTAQPQYCTGCKAARYCSVDCQRKAWGEGHKHQCKWLKERYVALDASLDAIDRAYASNEVAESLNVQSKDEIDYEILKAAMAVPPLDADGEVHEPSTDVFYRNLEMIFCGEWWFFENVDEAAYAEAALPLEQEKRNFEKFCHLLCYDVTRSSNAERIFQRRGLSCMHGCNALMPASRFIEIYRMGKASTDSNDHLRLKRETRNFILNFLMEMHHKPSYFTREV